MIYSSQIVHNNWWPMTIGHHMYYTFNCNQWQWCWLVLNPIAIRDNSTWPLSRFGHWQPRWWWIATLAGQILALAGMRWSFPIGALGGGVGSGRGPQAAPAPVVPRAGSSHHLCWGLLLLFATVLALFFYIVRLMGVKWSTCGAWVGLTKHHVS